MEGERKKGQLDLIRTQWCDLVDNAHDVTDSETEFQMDLAEFWCLLSATVSLSSHCMLARWAMFQLPSFTNIFHLLVPVLPLYRFVF